jgi:hypothetical protein
MAPDIVKIGVDRNPTLAYLHETSAMRCCAGFFMGTVCSSFRDPLFPFIDFFGADAAGALKAWNPMCDSTER